MSLNTLLNYSSAFFIVPKCDLTTQKVFWSKRRAVLVALANVLVIATIAYSLKMRTKDMYPVFKNKLLVFLDIANEGGGLLWFLSASVVPYFNKESWEELVKQLRDQDTTCEGQHQILLFNLVSVLVIAMNLVSWFVGGVVLEAQYLGTRLALMYLEGILFLTSLRMIYAIKKHYTSACMVLSVPSVPIIRKARAQYCRADKIVQLFNQVFGYNLFYLYFIVGVHYLNSLSRIAHWFLNSLLVVPFGPIHIIKSVVCMAVALVELVVLARASTETVQESQRLLNQCYRLQESFPLHSEEYLALQDLAHMIVNKKTPITAADFFDVNKSSMFALLSGATSYLMMIIQFQSGN